jgi:preprotein translocase SecF subunit
MIDILRYRWISATASIAILVAAISVGIYRIQTRGNAFTYSVDFTGGTQVLLQFSQNITPDEITQVLHEQWPSASVRTFGDREHMVRVADFSNDTQGLAARMVSILEEKLPGQQVTMLENEAVGAGVGKALRHKSLMAIILALIALLIYIAVRFWSLGFAVGAVVALVHDALIMLAVLLLFDREISMTVIGAILAVLGYSINDTIVIFSQIRDTLKSSKRLPLYDIVNVSLNQTMRRTILTSVSTALTVVSMLVLGGEALRTFSLTLLVGIIFGTYSSVFIASPVFMLFGSKDSQVSH